MGVGAVSGSGIFIKKGYGIRICKKNPDFCSVFRAELLAIEEALKFCFAESVNTDIWIFSDSRNSIQRLSKWWRHGDRMTTSTVHLLNSLSANVKIIFQ
ncbi:RNase H domain-containing protein [Trichonephila clavipes]|nr:RNase H domain-containing protein [Trichonephila clavipes]